MFNTARIKHELKRLGMIREKIEKVLDAAPEGTIYFRRRGKKQTPLPYRLIFIVLIASGAFLKPYPG